MTKGKLIKGKDGKPIKIDRKKGEFVYFDGQGYARRFKPRGRQKK